MNENEVKIIRKIIAVFVLVLFIVGLIKIFPLFMKLATEEGRIAFETQVESLGIKGALVIILLQICKIILVFLPGEPIELVAGMCFGPLMGFIVIYIGVALTNLLIIASVKKYGIKLVRDIVPEDKILKVRKMISENPGKSDITLFVLFFLPMLPKDFITYIAGLLPMTTKKLLTISLLGRFPAVLSSVLVGSKILDGDIKSIALIYLTTYVISGIIAMVYNKKIQKKGEKCND